MWYGVVTERDCGEQGVKNCDLQWCMLGGVQYLMQAYIHVYTRYNVEGC